MRTTNGSVAMCCAGLLACATAGGAAEGKGRVYYVATNGDDAWSGTLAAPNAGRTDGPFATITRARDAIRALKAKQGRLPSAVTVQVRAGLYSLTRPVTLEAQDSGEPGRPIRYEAYPGEAPVLSGARVVTGWRRHKGDVYVADVPDSKGGKGYFRQLFVDGKRQTRARFPNVDAADPLRKGFLYVDAGGFGLSVGCIHNAGDWMRYTFTAPADGTYRVWVRYAAKNKPFGRADMKGRTTITIDQGEPVALDNLPDTRGWGVYEWSHCATVPIRAGEHTFTWRNVKGGGLDLNAFVLCDDPQWRPKGVPPAPPGAGKHLVTIHAARFTASHGRQLRVSASRGGSKTFIRCKPGTAKDAWAAAPDAEVHIFQGGSCRAFKEICRIKAVDADGTGIHLEGKECLAPLCAGDRYFVENVREELDAPGEWWLDGQAGRLYYWPTGGAPEKSRAAAAATGRLFELLGDSKANKPVSHVTIAGFVMQETDYSPEDGCEGYHMGHEGTVYLRDATDCRVEGNRFVNVGTYGVCAIGGRGNRIAHNDVAHGAEGGVLLIDSAANIVTDNYVHHIGVVYKHVGGVVLEGAGCSENAVTHNLIHDSSRYGITLKNAGLKNRIEYNRMHRLNTETYDTGGIEVTQHNRTLRSGSKIRYNVVFDVGGYSCAGPKPMFMSWSIYLDSFAGGYEVSHNIVARNARGGLMVQGGKDNHVHNNIFVGSKCEHVLLANYAKNSSGTRFERNIVYCTEPGSTLFTAPREAHKTVRSDYNVFFHAAGDSLAEALAAWRKRGQDAHSIVADPLFVDPAHDDYTLRPNSPALKLGFKPIDATRIGLLRPRPTGR